MNTDYLKFKGINKVGYSLLMNEIESNLKLWLDWCLLGIGGWSDVELTSSGAYGGDFHTLHYVSDPSYTDGQVWETPRLDLVYESGVNFDSSSNPVAISGVYINNVFRPQNDATYGHYVDYPNGRVVFNTAINTADIVTMEYSYRDIQVSLADSSPMWKQLQYGSLRVDDDHLSTPTQGDWTAVPGIARQQMPAIIIESVPRRISRPFELGNGSLLVEQDILFHVVAQDRFWRNQMIDIISLQQDKIIYMFNTNEVAESSAYPLDYRGMINPNGVSYNTLVNRREENGYRWRELRFSRMITSEVETHNPNLYRGIVRATVEIVYGRI